MTEESTFNSCTRCACYWCAVSSSTCDTCATCDVDTEETFGLFLPGIDCEEYKPMLEVGALVIVQQVPTDYTIEFKDRRYTVKDDFWLTGAPEGLEGVDAIAIRKMVDYEGREKAIVAFSLVTIVDTKPLQ